MSEFDHPMRQVLGALECLSHGSTQSWNPSGAGENDSKLLADGESRVLDPPHVYWRRRYDAADEYRQERVLESARAELKAWRGWGRDAKKDLPSDAEILRDRILEAEGWSVQDVAVRLRCSETMIRKVRLAAGRIVSDGSRLGPVAEELGARERVAELASRGLSERQIGLLTGLPKTTIRRVLKRAA